MLKFVFCAAPVLFCSMLFGQVTSAPPPVSQAPNEPAHEDPVKDSTAATAPVVATQPPLQPASAPGLRHEFILDDATPVKLRINRTVSSGDAHVGDTVDFEVLEEVQVNGVVVVSKGASAFATVTQAEPKRRMARGGKLDINIDYVRLASGEKAALRAVAAVKGEGHSGAMTGGMVATSLIFFPAAPFFLFMHGKDITIPKGTELTAYVNGDMKLDIVKFQPSQRGAGMVAGSSAFGYTAGGAVSEVQLMVSSMPDSADIEIDGNFVGSTPSRVGIAPGQHEIVVKKSGFQTWERKIAVSSGQIKVDATLKPE
jgi:hypothetical protein